MLAFKKAKKTEKEHDFFPFFAPKAANAAEESHSCKFAPLFQGFICSEMT